MIFTAKLEHRSLLSNKERKVTLSSAFLRSWGFGAFSVDSLKKQALCSGIRRMTKFCAEKHQQVNE